MNKNSFLFLFLQIWPHNDSPKKKCDYTFPFGINERSCARNEKQPHLTYFRPHSEYFAMLFNVKAAVSLMCLVIGPSLSSWEGEREQRLKLHTSKTSTYVIDLAWWNNTDCEVPEHQVSRAPT